MGSGQRCQAAAQGAESVRSLGRPGWQQKVPTGMDWAVGSEGRLGSREGDS